MIEKCRNAAKKAICSDWFIPMQFFITAAALCAQLNVLGSGLLLLCSVLLLVFSDDTFAAICPLMFIVMAVTSFYKNYYALTQYWYVLIPFGAALLFHFTFYRKKPIFGRFLPSLAAVSLALVLGGVGVIPKNEYFSGTSLYYVLGLGLAMLLLYLLLCPRLADRREYDNAKRFAELVYSMALLAVLIIVLFYVTHWDYLKDDFHTPFISYRNFCTTVMMFGMPMPCMFIKQSKWHFAGIAVIYFGMLIGGSRSGLFFGSVELVLCLLYIYIKDKESRRFYRRAAAICALPALVLCALVIREFFFGDSGRMSQYFVKPTEARVSFYPQGVRDFLEKPLLGWGIGNMKNAEIYQGVEGSIIFYHNAVLQVLASMGILGGVAYLWQLVERIRLLREKRRTPAGLFAIPFAAVLMMSQTNPGIFCPLPTALLTVLMFAILEFSGGGEEEQTEI